jgi:hypothetical protein
MNYQEVYERYKRQFAEWSSINLMNIGEKTMSAVSQKQWAVARLHDTKRELVKLNKDKKKLKQSIVDKIAENSPVSIDKKSMEAIDNLPQLEEMNEEIKDCEFVIKYLEDVVKMYQYVNQDIKNIIDVIRLEQEK